MSPIRRVISKQLGELLLERKAITPEQLAKALEIQRQGGGFIGQILVNLGYAKEEDITQAFTTQYGFPYLPLENYEIDPEVIKIIPGNVAQQYSLIPVDKIENILTVATANPLNTQAIEDTEYISHCEAQVFVSTLTDITNAIKKYYKL